MNSIKIIFFGSTTDSIVILERLAQESIIAIVTQPPKPVGRKQIVTPTPVENWGKAHSLPVLSFPSHPQKPWLYVSEDSVSDALAPFKADLVVSASFGQKIPARTIREATYGGLNMHPSVLPRWRGADPIPWAILTGDRQTGVTIVTVNEAFDEGKVLAQHKIPMAGDELSDPLRTKLFSLGADLLEKILPDFLSGTLRGTTQDPKKASYARKFTREDGFIPWETIQKALTDPAQTTQIDRKFRALSPWPGLWSTVNKKRLKILTCHLSHDSVLILDTVQLEGKKPVSWKQFEAAYLPE